MTFQRVSLLLLCISSEFLPIVKCYDLTLLHVNDIHVKMEETNKYSSVCKPHDKQKGKCYGGVARLR